MNEVDLTRINNFQWNGKVRVKQSKYGFFQAWQVDYIELESNDGLRARLEPVGEGGVKATVILPVTTCPAETTSQPAEARECGSESVRN